MPHGVSDIGGTTMSDAAKNLERSAISTTLVTVKGDFHVQSTDTQGRYKNAEYLQYLLISMNIPPTENVLRWMGKVLQYGQKSI